MWISIFATVSAIGLLMCVGFFIYIGLCKACLDITDGSQAFSLILLVGMVANYMFVLFFAFQDTTGRHSWILCGLQVISPYSTFGDHETVN